LPAAHVLLLFALQSSTLKVQKKFYILVLVSVFQLFKLDGQLKCTLALTSVTGFPSRVKSILKVKGKKLN